jgi:xylulose-5-phosphate/fructose-6-phosphate phosphoketolase
MQRTEEYCKERSSVPGLAARAAYTKQFLRDKLIEHRAYIARHGENLPEIGDWKWTSK